ncbi:MAG TPA: carbon-nitrogen hydrolase family protein [Gaiellales bacterium]|nr:carbon-nitrogen hydrolase family protein [Gaiellales bacterium]
MTVRIAVGQTPLTATLDEAVPAAVAAVEEAGRLGADVLCLPETCLPGHRSQPREVPDYTAAELDAAVEAVAAAAGGAGVVTIVGAERPSAAGREIVAVVAGADGSRLGVQAKTQIDPSEERDYVPGSGRRCFDAAGIRFAVAICHEAFRYPEVARAAALDGAQVVFVPHFVVTDDGSLSRRWCDADNPYNEKALLCRALENTVYVAAVNAAAPDQGSASCVISPDGALLAQVPYGTFGVAVADIDPALADGLMARRFAPERTLAPA